MRPFGFTTETLGRQARAFKGQVWIIDGWRPGHTLHALVFLSNVDTTYKNKSESRFRKDDGKYVFTISQFDGFPRDTHTLLAILYWTRPSCGGLLPHTAVR